MGGRRGRVRRRVRGAFLRPGLSFMAQLRTSHLVKVYGKRRVVDSVNVHILEGEIVGLLGPNGAGKTTTFNMVIGFIRPTEGAVFFDEREITSYSMHERVGLGISYLAQETSIFRKLSVRQNLLAILEFQEGLSRRERYERADELMEDLLIAHLADSAAETLSGGERRRCEIARALATNPRFLLLDEPFAGIDPKTIEELQAIIFQMKARGLGILITDHNVRETLEVTDRSYIIYQGKVDVSGTRQEIISSERARRIYLGKTFDRDLMGNSAANGAANGGADNGTNGGADSAADGREKAKADESPSGSETSSAGASALPSNSGKEAP